MSHAHATAPTEFVEAKGIRFAFRRFGTKTGVPLVFMQHFRGGLDHWDPAITDGLAGNRPVILFDNAGVAGSSGETPETIDAMGDYAVAFVHALGLAQVDSRVLDWRLRGTGVHGSATGARQAPHAVRHRAARRRALAGCEFPTIRNLN